ncbi:hypothetical protein H9I45_00810 [Polaribacter haliotis]|uniref:Uncharacterized protein n=2 Tax=Polaribacter TaxID=52959 RepID=A0A7L8AGC5_9FLAO|nr:MULTISPECIES: hypothetical protein [Polaribacter]MDD7914113.1 hypothetical protein [Polaribacter sp. MSW5]QOD61010.1 hypothetical protein H9I45_00810 [Polaribacter haliotis]
MSIREFEKELVKAPFLGKPHYPISGLDQLGLNLTSERVFDLLLPGLNNVTQRIRYYSFYCWFFDWYATSIRNTSKKNQNKFLRRAEFLLALISAHKKQSGVPGISKALTIYELNNDVINLIEGTQEGKSSEGSYWKNPRGVLGQYYISSIKELGILRDQGNIEGLYIRTDFKHESKISGKLLADSFKKNTKNTLPIFIEAIESNSVSKNDLEKLSNDFNMVIVPFNSDEQELLWKLFSGTDRPKEKKDVFFRKATIQLLLESSNLQEPTEKFNQLDVPLTIYSKGWNEDKILAEKLWYFFIMEQFWSVANTGCLDAFLEILNDKSNNSWISEVTFTENLIQEIENYFEKENIDIEKDLFFKTELSDLTIQHLVELSKKEKDAYQKIIYALLAIQKLFVENNSIQDELLKISNSFNIHTSGSFLQTMTEFKDKENISIKKFITYFLTNKIINRHYFVALKKLNDTQNSAKFYRDEGLIRFVDSFIYDYSSPRIHTLYGFMQDLNIIEKEKIELTVLGKEKLNSLTYEN